MAYIILIFVLILPRTNNKSVVTGLQTVVYKLFVTQFMGLIKNSVCPLIDQRPKAVPGHTFNEKVFPHNLASRAICYVNTANPRRLNTPSETKYNTHVEWASYVVRSLKLACSSID